MPTIHVRPGADLHMQEVADTVGKSKKVVVVTGAGISTNCGIPDFRSENGLYSLIQAQYDAAVQNPPWESRDDFEIDDRPKKKRRANERWYFEVVYPEGMGPEDFEDLDETDEEQMQQSSDSQDERKIETRGRTTRSATKGPSQHSPPSIKKLANDNCVEGLPAGTESLEELRPLGLSLQPPHSIAIPLDPKRNSLDESKSLDAIIQIPQPHSPEQATNSVDQSTIITESVSYNLEVPTPNQRLIRPNLTTITSSSTRTSRSDVFGSSSPLSSLPSSPILPIGSQLATLLNQSEEGYKHSDISHSHHFSTSPPSTHERILQRDDSGYKSSRSDDENTNFDSSQGSYRPLRNFKGRDLFDSIIWADAYSTSIFYMFITSFRQKINNDVKSTSPTHKFIRTLRDGGRLVRNYTQNIDSLEEREGLATDLTLGTGSRARFNSKTQRQRRPSDVPGDSPHSTGVECVQLHGNLVSLRCGLCSRLSPWEEADRESTTLSGQAPDCPSCTEYNAKRTGRGRRGLAVGRLRPDIVLYGEEHPSAHLVGPLITHDLGLGPDVLLIMGTSLKVHGLKVMVKEFAKAVHTKGGKVIFVNRTKPPESTWSDVIDYWVECDCDSWVLDLKARREDIWLPQGSVAEDSKTRRELSREESGKAKQKPDTKKTSRPQTIRDDRMSGAYHTFKILDILCDLKDDQGQIASRPTYWQKTTRASIGSIPGTETSKRVGRGRPARKDSNNMRKANQRRKTYPSCEQDKNQELEKTKYLQKHWAQLRAVAPGLPEKMPESVVQSGRVELAELEENLPSYLQPFKFTFNPGGYDRATSSHIPNLKGLGLSSQMGLINCPPSGAALPLHSPRRVDERKSVAHSYGTRTRGRFLSGNSLVADGTFSAEDTIIVEAPSAPLTPLTPNARRIKRMSSLGTILSSSPEIYHDAEEGPNKALSASSQEFHDAIEWRSRI